MKALKIAAAVVGVLIIGVVIFVMTFDANQYRGLIQDQAKAATGRDVQIGNIALAVSLSPVLVVSDVNFANAPWGSRPQMATFKSLEAHTQLIPLLFGDIKISGLKVVDADVVLETDAQGKGNWEFDVPTGATPASDDGGTALAISGLSAENLKLTYRDRRAGTDAAVAAKTLDVAVSGALADLNVSSVSATGANISFKDSQTAVAATVDSFNMKAQGSITNLNVSEINANKADVNYKAGQTTAAGTVGSASIKAQGSLKDLNITHADVKDAKGTYKDAGTAIDGGVASVELDGKGKLADLAITKIILTDGQVTYKGADAPATAKVVKLTLGDNGALDLDATVDGQPLKVTGTIAPLAELGAKNKAFPAKLKIDAFGLKAETDLMVDMTKQTPAIKGTITVAELTVPPSKAAASDKVFPADPLPWDALTAADADVKISVAKITLSNGMMLSNVNLPVNLAGGRLAANGVTMQVAGGTITADVGANFADKSVTLKAGSKDLTAENLAKTLKMMDRVTGGPIDVAVDVRGNGASVQQVMAGLDGSVVIGMGQGRIRQDALNFLGGDVIMQVVNLVNPLGNKDPYTIAQCAVMNLRVNDGIATTNDGIALVTDKMVVRSSGTIDLRQERLNLTVRPKATSGIGAGLGKLIQMAKVSGTLAKPAVGIDKSAAVSTVGSLLGAFATGGASMLAQGLRDKADANDANACQDARNGHLAKR